MDSRQQALQARLDSFTFDAPDTRLRFVARLARENGWSVAHAERVLREYKRYCYLAMEAGHPVTPSEDVDQAWHLHMVYTHSYWGEFCPNVLGKPLHHGPTKGGPAEAIKHDDWYRRTLASYERHFGEKPPVDIWPDSESRFDHDIAWTRVNRRDYWLLPKPKLNRLAAPMAVAVMVTFILGCADTDPLNWSGPEFLALFIGLLAAIVGINLIVRTLLRGGSMPVEDTLTPSELGYLQGGKHRLFLTVMTDLVRRGHLKTTPNQILPGTPLPRDENSLEREVVEQLQSRGLKKAATFVTIDTKPLHESLAERGLLVSSGRGSMIVLLNVIPLLVLLGFGIAKINVGIARDKPVTFLVILCVVTFFIIMATTFKPFLTASGRRLLKERRRHHIGLRGGANDFNDSNPQVPLAVALFGVAALELGAFGDLRTLMKPLPGSGFVGTGASSSGCTSSSGCSSGDGGGGGGCGGCGGGGGD
ncbi:TIGR04222 domain-containing membrane protein [soil metagenome]